MPKYKVYRRYVVWLDEVVEAEDRFQAEYETTEVEKVIGIKKPRGRVVEVRIYADGSEVESAE